MLLDMKISSSEETVDLSALFAQFCPLKDHKVSIYDPASNRFASLEKLGAENGFLHKQYLEPRIILIRYKRRFEYAPDSDGPDSSLEPDSQTDKRDGRSRERTIAEVI